MDGIELTEVNGSHRIKVVVMRLGQEKEGLAGIESDLNAPSDEEFEAVKVDKFFS